MSPQSMSQQKIIYDFGSNNGDDIPYYLKKGDMVIAIEANPFLCKQIENRFLSDIQNGRLFIENCVLTADEVGKEVCFYIHKRDPVLSRFPKPDNIHDFEEALLPCQSVLGVIQRYGDPYYIKIDIEHYDHLILRTLFLNGIQPPFISAESHCIEVFSLLVSLGKYNAFKLVDGRTVSKKYNKYSIVSNNGRELYSFPYDSAGPFGDDIAGEWMTAENFFRLLAFEGLGWKDIHATNQIQVNPTAAPRLRHHVQRVLMRTLIDKIRPVTPKRLLEILERRTFL
jgi:FkbM family methyltransferase